MAPKRGRGATASSKAAVGDENPPAAVGNAETPGPPSAPNAAAVAFALVTRPSSPLPVTRSQTQAARDNALATEMVRGTGNFFADMDDTSELLLPPSLSENCSILIRTTLLVPVLHVSSCWNFS